MDDVGCKKIDEPLTCSVCMVCGMFFLVAVHGPLLASLGTGSTWVPTSVLQGKCVKLETQLPSNYWDWGGWAGFGNFKATQGIVN